MTKITLRPDNANLADDSDATYIDGNLEAFMQNLALPAGAVIKGVTMRVRTAQVGGNSGDQVKAEVVSGGDHRILASGIFAGYSSPTTVAAVGVTDATDAEIDVATIRITEIPSGVDGGTVS